MTIVISRHAFRMDNVAVIMTPVVAAAQEAVEGMETSEDDRYDALPFAHSARRVGLEPVPVTRLTCGFAEQADISIPFNPAAPHSILLDPVQLGDRHTTSPARRRPGRGVPPAHGPPSQA
ncbi:hypothetical protein [Streptomyces sp. NPDC015125]|uniref:hypothetical protein n=1 Tax=Streptomyces sp. NPDC015125 TaxID=3364938 RepID=UPI003702EB0D